MNFQKAGPIPSESMMYPTKQCKVGNQGSAPEKPSNPLVKRDVSKVEPRRANVHQHEEECRSKNAEKELCLLFMSFKGFLRSPCFRLEICAHDKVEGPEHTKGGAEGGFINRIHKTSDISCQTRPCGVLRGNTEWGVARHNISRSAR